MGGDLPALRNQLQEMVDGQWDLTTQFPVHGSTPGSRIGALLNTLLGKISGALTHCAASAITLSKISPQLATLSADLAANARAQAARTQEIAASVSFLDTASNDLKGIADLIERTAFQTKLLAVNAAIEATRAGEKGRAFGVVAEEIERLSRETSQATGKVTSMLEAIREQIAKTAQAVGTQTTRNPQDKVPRKDSLSVVACKQAEQAATLNTLAQRSHAASDQLAVGIGVFRIAPQRRAQGLVEELAQDSDMTLFHPDTQERRMRSFIARHTEFELLYVTDWTGRQVTRNVGGDDFEAVYKTNGLGSDWSARPWFVGARKTGKSFVSDVYRSAASNAFCFTVATTIFNKNGAPGGVLGADVRLENLLAIQS